MIKRTLALEPWRVLGNAVSSPSVLKEARAVYNVQLDEKKAIFDKRYKKLKGYFDRLAKKSPKKLKFEDIL